ncbi:MAG: DUF4834 family protein [Bacteroidota bacterium]|nr:DUF4834 family protein [Bacteroidota bacterium]
MGVMRDVIWTIIIIWVIYKIVGMFRSVSAVKKTFVYNKHETHNHTQSTKPEGSVTVESQEKHQGKTPKANSNGGEYVDFEEIK